MSAKKQSPAKQKQTRAKQKLSRGESVEVARSGGESASGEALPEGWVEIELGDVMSIRNGYAFKSKEFQKEGVPLIRQSNLGGRTVDLESAMRLPPEYLEEYARFSLKQSDILIGMSGSIGKLCLYDKAEVGLQNQRTGKIDFLDDSIALHGYLWFFLQTVQRRLADKGKGIGVLNVSAGDIETLKLTLPPEAEQSRIVSAIESLQERSSRARVLLSEVGPLIGQLRQSVLRGAFSGRLTADWRASQNSSVEPASELLLRIRTERRERWEAEQLAKYEAKGKQPPKNWQDKYKEPEPVDESELPELPDDWCWARFANICDVQGGFAFKSKDYCDEGVALIRIGDLDDGFVNIDETTQRLPADYWEQHPKVQLAHGDVLIAMSGATTGKMAVFECDEPAVLNQRVGRFVAHSDNLIHPPYLRGLVESIVEDIRSRAYGGAQPNISPTEIESTPIAFPPLAEQIRIAELIGETREACGRVDTEVASMESSLTQLDQSILSKAFRGELVPQDPRDEPASKLLACIRTTRETATSTNATKKTTRKRKAKADA